MDLTKEMIAHVQETALSKNRAATITAPDGSGRWWLFDDQDHTYKEQDRFVKESGKVSTVESLFALVKDTLRRHGNTSGDGARVTFTSAGAHFNPNVADGRHAFEYGRVLSQQWKTFEAAATSGETYTHKEFMALLQQLAPSIVDYPAIAAAYRRVTVTRNAQVTSSPVLVDGQRGGGYQFQLTVGGAEEFVPASFQVVTTYTRGGLATYPLTMDVDVDEHDGQLEFRLSCPTLATIADQAVMDELATFKASADEAGMSDLLVVLNF